MNDTLIGARLALLQEAEKHWQMADNALAIATAERALRQQAKMGRGAVTYRVELKRRAVEEANDAM